MESKDKSLSLWTWLGLDDWLASPRAELPLLAAFICSTAALFVLSLPDFDGATRIFSIPISPPAGPPVVVSALLACAIAFLFFGMLRYWMLYDSSSKRQRVVWLCVLVAGVWIGACIYYLCVYSQQIQNKREDAGVNVNKFLRVAWGFLIALLVFLYALVRIRGPVHIAPTIVTILELFVLVLIVLTFVVRVRAFLHKGLNRRD